MRLWSIHPHYLDAKGLVALWREGLLAQHVLAGTTIGYTNHPQLLRFREAADSLAAINWYLHYVWQEANRRGYAFDKSKIVEGPQIESLSVTDQQLQYELAHLQQKLRLRSPHDLIRIQENTQIMAHPLFTIIAGPIAAWEKI